MLRLKLLLLGNELRLLDGEKQHGYGNKHDRRNDHKQRLIVDVRKALDLAVWVHNRGHAEVDNATERAHEVYDRVALAAQGIGRNVRHERNRRGTIGAHCNEQQTENDHERNGLEGCRRCNIAVVDKRQQVHEYDRKARAEKNKRHALADLGVRFVRDCAEQRQQEQCKHVVGRHYRAGIRLVEVECVGQYKWNDAVVHLPERADGQERKARQYGAFVVKLHFLCSPSGLVLPRLYHTPPYFAPVFSEAN